MRSPMKVLAACMMLTPFLFVELSSAIGRGQVADTVPPEDYELYERVIEDKFLSSQIQLVLLERMSVSQLVPSQPDSMTMAFFQRQGFFDGVLPEDLVRDFVGANQVRSRLESRFRLGVRYRFVSGEKNEEIEARFAVPAMNGQKLVVQASSVLDRLAFSRVGRTLKNDHALVYVENRRPDGTGAAFLVWFHRQEQGWDLVDTEVVWTIRESAAEAESP